MRSFSDSDPRSYYFKSNVHHSWNNWYRWANDLACYFSYLSDGRHTYLEGGIPHLLYLLTYETGQIEHAEHRYDYSKFTQEEIEDLQSLGKLIDKANDLITRFQREAKGYEVKVREQRNGLPPQNQLIVPPEAPVLNLLIELRRVCEEANKLIYHIDECVFFKSK